MLICTFHYILESECKQNSTHCSILCCSCQNIMITGQPNVIHLAMQHRCQSLTHSLTHTDIHIPHCPLGRYAGYAESSLPGRHPPLAPSSLGQARSRGCRMRLYGPDHRCRVWRDISQCYREHWGGGGGGGGGGSHEATKLRLTCSGQ